MATRRTRGFTLVELLVVITIIGMLAALLLPAVGAAIESARRTQCQNNLREVSRAVQSYSESKKGAFPPSFGSPRLINAVNGPGGTNETWPWPVYILNELDEETLYKAIEKRSQATGDGLANATYLAIFDCPSDDKNDSRPALSYGANMGIPDGNIQGASAPADLASNGIFHFRKKNAAGLYVGNVIQFKDDDIKDGRANTLLFVENTNATGDWANPANLNEYSLGVVWDPTDDPPNDPSPHFNDAPNVNAPNYPNAIPNSFHPLVFVAAFADGSTAELNENMAYEVYCRLMTPRGETAGTTGNPQLNYQTRPITANDLE